MSKSITTGNEVLLENSHPFWFVKQDKLKFKSRSTAKFLELYGWGFFQNNKDRTVKKELFHNDNGVLRIHNEETAKKWVLNLLESLDEKVFLEGILQTPNGVGQDEVLDGWINLSNDQWKKILGSMTVYSEEDYQNTIPIKVFRDNSDTCHIRFRNGVVKIQATDIEIIQKDELKDEGTIWESEQHSHNIELDSKSVGLFETFVINAFKKRDHSKNSEDWTQNYVLDEDQLRSFREAYGYLLHGHKSMDKLKCVLCYDSEGTFDNPMGGNGKTLTMDSIKYYKQISTLAGKQWMKGDKFVWSDVTPETKFVLINDIEKDFNFQDLFNVITDDFQTEGKGVNKVIIPKEKSPKVAITSNGIITGSGSSFERRKHVVEYGNYWKRCVDEGESVSDDKHLGKQLFSQFTDEDWNDFYNFGFRCVQEYLRNGLTESISENYVERAKIVTLEGTLGTGEVTKWMNKWVKTTRIDDGYNEGEGITEESLYQMFVTDNPLLASHMPSGYDKSRFHQVFFDFVMMTDGYYYNERRSKHGDTKSARRWLRGERGNQEAHILVTSDFDVKPKVIINNDNDDDDDINYFEKLAS